MPQPQTTTTNDNDLQPCSLPRTYSASHIVRNFMTLPTPSRRENAEKAAAAAAAMSEEDPGPGGSGSGLSTWGIRRGSRHGRSKQAASSLTKQHSLDHIDDPSSELWLLLWVIVLIFCLVLCLWCSYISLSISPLSLSPSLSPSLPPPLCLSSLSLPLQPMKSVL